MSVVDLAVLYTLVGVALAVLVLVRQGATWQSAATATLVVLVWPFFAPLALRREEWRARSAPSPTRHAIAAALADAQVAVSGSPLATLLPEEATTRILDEVARIEARRDELAALLGREDLDEHAARSRLARLEREGASPRAVRTARLHLENVRKLAAVHARDVRSLAEIEELVNALRTQLVLARFAGSSAEGVSAIVAEVWARVEGVGAAMDELNETA